MTATIDAILAEAVGEKLALFLDGGMFVDGKVISTDSTTVTLEVKINAERQAFSGGDDLRKVTIIHATIAKEKIFRVDRIASAGAQPRKDEYANG